MEATSYGTYAAVVGLVVGLVFGVLVMLSGAWSAMAVLGFGVGGAVLSWIAYGATSGQLDFGAAWRALLRKGP